MTDSIAYVSYMRMSSLPRSTTVTLLFAVLLAVSAQALASPTTPPAKTAAAVRPAHTPQPLGAEPLAASDPTTRRATAQQAAIASAATASPVVDPFSSLAVVVARESLPPIKSVRVRQVPEADKGVIKTKRSALLLINTQPKGAMVFWGRRRLGKTPLRLPISKEPHPMDVRIRFRGFMTLRTRVDPRLSQKYFYVLTPAKYR